MRHSFLKYPGVLLGVVLLAPGAALAGEPAAGAPSSPAGRAAQLYQEGNTFYDQGKHAEAEARYQAAWDIQRSFDIAGNLGNVELEVHQPRDAAEHLSYALDIFPLGDTPEKKAFLEKRLAEAKKQIGVVTVTVNVAGADVLVDGRLLGRSPLQAPVFVDPGAREIEVRLGGKTATRSILVGKGSEQEVALAIDTGPNMTIVIAGGAAGLAGIGAGVTFALLSNGKASDAEDLKASGGPPGDLAALRDDQALFANVSFWSFVGGGVALAGTGVYVLTTLLGQPAPAASTEARPGSRTTGAASPSWARVQAAPVVLPGGGGMVVGGRF